MEVYGAKKQMLKRVYGAEFRGSFLTRVCDGVVERRSFMFVGLWAFASGIKSVLN